MSVIAEVLRLAVQLLAYAWHARRPLFPMLVLVVGAVGLIALAVGLAAPVAIYPLL